MTHETSEYVRIEHTDYTNHHRRIFNTRRLDAVVCTECYKMQITCVKIGLLSPLVAFVDSSLARIGL